MATRKTQATNQNELDQHLDLAFKRILKVVKQLLQDLEMQPGIEAAKGLRSYSRTLRGFIQNKVGKKSGFSVTVNLEAQLIRAKNLPE